MTQDSSPITGELPEPMLVLHASYPTDADLDGLEDPIIEAGFQYLPDGLRALITDSAETSPDWESFINEAIQLATLRAKGVPQTTMELLQALGEWRNCVNSGAGLPPLTEAEETSLNALLNLLRQEALKTVQHQLKVLSEQLALLIE